METIWKEQFNDSISISNDCRASYIFETGSKGTLFITLQKESKISLDMQIKENASIRIFVYNQAQGAVQLEVTTALKKDAYCQMAVLDMQDAPFYWKHHVVLQEPGADYEIMSGQLCSANQEKKCDMEVRHSAPHTYGQIKNFAVLMSHGHYEMVANGNITKGCFDSHSHQATRVLTLGKDHLTKCIPLLLIDENAVKASHALSVGQPDEDQMYYLESRGLNKKQAIGLLSVGYLLPVIKMVDDEELRKQLQEEMESKVGLYGRQ